MKRILTLALVFIMSVSLLSACSDGGNSSGGNTPPPSSSSGGNSAGNTTPPTYSNDALDFKSIEDTETGTILSLGDKKEKFDNALGASTLEDEYDGQETYSYLNGHIGVTFEDDKAIYIVLAEDTNRIKFKDMSFDMSLNSIETGFEFNDAWSSSSDNKYYYRYYDNTGNDTTEANAAYEAEISVRPDGTIRRITISDSSDGSLTHPPTKTPSDESVDRLNPPAWLIGEWVTEAAHEFNSEGITVTEHNVVVSSGNLDFSWQINNMGLEITETTDDNHYRLEYTHTGLEISYDFRLQADGSMILMLFDSTPTMLYTKK